MGWDSTAFVLYNRYLDIADAIEDNNADASSLDNSDFETVTDIPFETLSIPGEQTINASLREQVKEWVLSASLDHHIEKVLRGIFESNYFTNFI